MTPSERAAVRVSVGPELVEILRRLSAHRSVLWERTYGQIKLASDLAAIIGEFRDALDMDDFGAADRLLGRLVTAAGPNRSTETLRKASANLRTIMDARLAAMAVGDRTFDAGLADFGPEVAEAYDVWTRLNAQPCSREDRAAYWRHPLPWLCERLEQRLGIDRHDLEIAADRLNSTLGLRGMEPFLAPDGTVADKGQPDWLWMLPKFTELDRDGTTGRLWNELRAEYSDVVTEAGLVADGALAAGSVDGIQAQDTAHGGELAVDVRHAGALAAAPAEFSIETGDGTANLNTPEGGAVGEQPDNPQKRLPQRPIGKAFRAWYVRDTLALTTGEPTQQEVADIMTREGCPAKQGQVSKWLRAVKEYRDAGGIMPTLDELNKGDIDTVDPDVIDMGPRQDGRTPRQRLRRDDDADSWSE